MIALGNADELRDDRFVVLRERRGRHITAGVGGGRDRAIRVGSLAELARQHGAGGGRAGDRGGGALQEAVDFSRARTRSFARCPIRIGQTGRSNHACALRQRG